MPELEYFVVAESHSVDRDTNSISIFNVFSERVFDEFPVTISRLVIISCWIASDEEIRHRVDSQLQVLVKIPDSEPEDSVPINFTCDIEFQHVLLEYQDLYIQRPCRVEIEMLFNGNHKARHLIAFKQR